MVILCCQLLKFSLTPWSKALCPQLLKPLSVAGNTQERGARYDLTTRGIIWKKPKERAMWHPEISGDLKPFVSPHFTHPVYELTKYAVDEYDRVSPTVQRLLSIEFGHSSAERRLNVYQIVSSINRHQYDQCSIEARIALLTAHIRYLQQESYREKLMKFGENRSKLTRMLRARRILLYNLRKVDYKKFEWLIEKLDILYKPILEGKMPRVLEYDCWRKLVAMRCETVKSRRFEAYKQELDSQKVQFEKDKLETLSWIKTQEEKLNIPVTVDPDNRIIDLYEKERVHTNEFSDAYK